MFKAGDVVYLKSGGPLLTLVHVAEDGQAEVCWFAGDSFKTAELPSYCLTKG